METTVVEGYGLVIGTDITLDISKVTTYLAENNYIDSNANIDAKGLEDIVDYLRLDNGQELIDILVKNTRGEGLVSYIDTSSGQEWLAIQPVYPWNTNDSFYGLNQNAIVEIFLESIRHFVVESSGLEQKMDYLADFMLG